MEIPKKTTANTKKTGTPLRCPTLHLHAIHWRRDARSGAAVAAASSWRRRARRKCRSRITSVAAAMMIRWMQFSFLSFVLCVQATIKKKIFVLRARRSRRRWRRRSSSLDEDQGEDQGEDHTAAAEEQQISKETTAGRGFCCDTHENFCFLFASSFFFRRDTNTQEILCFLFACCCCPFFFRVLFACC